MDKQDVFTSLLLSMPDDTFFYIMRNYLGPLQTPFHKPTLIKKLISFLTRTEVLQRIAEIADTVDRKILTAVSMLEEPSIQDIFEIFKDELEFFQLHYAVLNLEERLLPVVLEARCQEVAEVGVVGLAQGRQDLQQRLDLLYAQVFVLDAARGDEHLLHPET